MADNTKIEWARHPVTGKGATWNPITGCSLVSEGCRHCYAARNAATRMKNHPSRRGLARFNAAGEAKFTGEVRFNDQWLDQPLRWRAPRGIFVCAHSDLFHENVPDEWIDRVFAIMALCPQHVFFVLTKRPERMRDYLRRPAGNGRQDVRNHLAWDVSSQIMNRWAPGWRGEGIDGKHRSRAINAFTDWPLPNVWLGTSIEDQATADTRIPCLLATPAARRFVSAEPLLGPVDLEIAWHKESALDAECWGDCAWCKNGHTPLHNCHEGRQSEADFWRGRSGLDWVISGGESGPHARPSHPDWHRTLRDHCAEAGVPFLFKQWGSGSREVISSRKLWLL